MDTQMILCKELQFPFIDQVLKPTKNSSEKSIKKNMITFQVELLFPTTTESYSIHCAAINNTENTGTIYFVLKKRSKRNN